MKTSVGQCLLSVIPVRAEGKSQAEIVTQLIYGETYRVLESTEDWIKVSLDFDAYEGWISANQFAEKIFEPEGVFTKALFVTYQGTIIPLGGHIPEKVVSTKQDILTLAKEFLGCPYLWGGRTFMGIDCSGFVQIVHKAAGVKLPRDASQQVTEGVEVDFVDRQSGDLVFFKSKSGKIHHVGLMVSKDEIIHAAGCIRIDTLTQDGIFNKETGKQSHAYHQIRRLI